MRNVFASRITGFGFYILKNNPSTRSMERKVDPPEKENASVSSAHSFNSGHFPSRNSTDDSLAESSPADARSDEKVIANEHTGIKSANSLSQTVANPKNRNSYDNEIRDERQEQEE